MRFVRLDNCKPGMEVARDVMAANGLILIKHGSILKESYLEALDNLGYTGIYIRDDLNPNLPEENTTIPEKLRNESVETVRGVLTRIKTLGAKDNTQAFLQDIENLLSEIMSQVSKNRGQTSNINALKTFDQYTYQHSLDVTVLSLIIGTELGLSRPELNSLGKSAFFHDIGKLYVPITILNKPSSLTKEEFDEVKKHPELGHALLKDTLKLEKNIYESALYHHERYDGSGYPHGIYGDHIPFFSRIIAVADTYDAMTSRRIYRNALPASEVYEYIMGNSGHHFDPAVVDAFLRKVAPFPVGTTIVLSDGRYGVVIKNNANFMMRPLIRILRISEEDSQEEIDIDLATDQDALNITIMGTL